MINVQKTSCKHDVNKRWGSSSVCAESVMSLSEVEFTLKQGAAETLNWTQSQNAKDRKPDVKVSSREFIKKGKFLGRKEKQNNEPKTMETPGWGNKIKMAAMAGNWVSQGGTGKRKYVVWAQWLSLETIHKRKRRSSVVNRPWHAEWSGTGGRQGQSLKTAYSTCWTRCSPQVSLGKTGEIDFRHWIYSDDFRRSHCFCRLYTV